MIDIDADFKVQRPTRTIEFVYKYKYDAVRAILREREDELLELKGPCSNTRCMLHYAHRGPCDVR